MERFLWSSTLLVSVIVSILFSCDATRTPQSLLQASGTLALRRELEELLPQITATSNESVGEDKQVTALEEETQEDLTQLEGQKGGLNTSLQSQTDVQTVESGNQIDLRNHTEKVETELVDEPLVLHDKENEERTPHLKPEDENHQDVTTQDKEFLELSQSDSSDGKSDQPALHDVEQSGDGEGRKDEVKDVREDGQEQDVKDSDKEELEKYSQVEPLDNDRLSSPTPEPHLEDEKVQSEILDQVQLKNETVKVDEGNKMDHTSTSTETNQLYLSEGLTSTDFPLSLDPDDDYPDFFNDLMRLPEMLQESAEHLKTNVPGWEKLSVNSKVLFNQANEQIKESVLPLVGREYASTVAYLVSYGLLLVPLGIVVFLFARIHAIFTLQKVLLFVNIYIAAYFAALVAAAFMLGSEPLDFFRQFSPTSYIVLQLLQAFGYFLFILLQTLDLISTCSVGRVAAKLSATVQWLVVSAVGFHYYVTVVHRAMAKSKPLTSWKVYAVYSLLFTILCPFARIERGKKQYLQASGQESTKQS